MIIKCAHDPLLDPSTGKTMAPHLITDCTDLCKHLADAIAKTEFQDTERELYVVTAAKATEVAKKARKILEKYVKVVAKAQKKSKSAAAKAAKANSKAAAKAKKAVEKTAKSLANAQKSLQEAKLEVVRAEKADTTAAQKAAKAIRNQKDIVQAWRAVFGTSKVCHKNVESCKLYLVPCKREGSDCQCKRFCWV